MTTQDIFQQRTPHPAVGDRHAGRMPNIGRPVLAYNRVDQRFYRHVVRPGSFGRVASWQTQVVEPRG